jgi:AcrR family transcriptional regulator
MDPPEATGETARGARAGGERLEVDTGLRWVRPPRQARSQETLERILDAAQALIVEKGFEDTPVSEIVRRAGSSVGAFYTRFHDKQGLLGALNDRFYAEAMATADDALDPARWEGAGAAEILHAVVRFLVQVYREHGPLIRAFVIRNHVSGEFQMRQGRVYQYVAVRLSQLLLERGAGISHPEPERAIGFGLTLVFSTLDSTILFGDARFAQALSDDQLAAELSRAYLAYLGVQTPNH